MTGREGKREQWAGGKAAATRWHRPSGERCVVPGGQLTLLPYWGVWVAAGLQAGPLNLYRRVSSPLPGKALGASGPRRWSAGGFRGECCLDPQSLAGEQALNSGQDQVRPPSSKELHRRTVSTVEATVIPEHSPAPAPSLPASQPVRGVALSGFYPLKETPSPWRSKSFLT